MKGRVMQDPDEKAQRAGSPEEAMARIQALMSAIETELEIQRQAVDILSGQGQETPAPEDAEPTENGE